MKTIYLLRHGAVAARYRRRFIGRTDAPLSALGRRQARRLAALFGRRPRLAVLSSPLRRARATARLAAPGMNRNLHLLSDLREMDFGRWEGLTFAEILRRDPSLVDEWSSFKPSFRFPGGESLRAFKARLGRLAKKLLHHRAEELLVVAHGGVIRSLICLWKKKPLRLYPEIQVRPGSLSVVRVKGRRPRVVSVGE